MFPVMPDQSPRLDARVVAKLALEDLHFGMLHVMNYQARALREYLVAYLAVNSFEHALKLVFVSIGARYGDSELFVGILWQCFEPGIVCSARNGRFPDFPCHLWSWHA